MHHQLAREATHVLAGGIEFGHGPEDRRRIALQDGAGQPLQFRAGDKAEHGERVRLGNRVALERNQLIERGKRVAHAALRPARDGEERIFVRMDRLLAADVLEPVDNLVRLDAAEVEALAARDDRREHLVALGRCEDELHIGRRLLQRLEERIPRRRGEHVAFIDDEDLVLRGGGLELHRLDDGTHILHLVVGSAIQLHHVQGAPFGDLYAVLAFAARLRAVRMETVERLGEDAARRGLADAARPHEEVGVRDASRLDRMLQRPHHMLLPDDVVERHWTVLQRQRHMLPPFARLSLFAHGIQLGAQ